MAQRIDQQQPQAEKNLTKWIGKFRIIVPRRQRQSYKIPESRKSWLVKVIKGTVWTDCPRETRRWIRSIKWDQHQGHGSLILQSSIICGTFRAQRYGSQWSICTTRFLVTAAIHSSLHNPSLNWVTCFYKCSSFAAVVVAVGLRCILLHITAS